MSSVKTTSAQSAMTPVRARPDGPELLREPWLIAALGLYLVNLVIAAVISRPNLRRLVGLSRSGTDDGTWARRARQQRYVAYGMAGLIGVIGFLMSTKPDLW